MLCQVNMLALFLKRTLMHMFCRINVFDKGVFIKPQRRQPCQKGWQKPVKRQFNLQLICLFYICCDCAPFTRCISIWKQHFLHTSVNKSSHNDRESMITMFFIDLRHLWTVRAINKGWSLMVCCSKVTSYIIQKLMLPCVPDFLIPSEHCGSICSSEPCVKTQKLLPSQIVWTQLHVWQGIYDILVFIYLP